MFLWARRGCEFGIDIWVSGVQFPAGPPAGYLYLSGRFYRLTFIQDVILYQGQCWAYYRNRARQISFLKNLLFPGRFLFYPKKPALAKKIKKIILLAVTGFKKSRGSTQLLLIFVKPETLLVFSLRFWENFRSRPLGPRGGGSRNQSFCYYSGKAKKSKEMAGLFVWHLAIKEVILGQYHWQRSHLVTF